MAATASYWCYRCNQSVHISNEDITCPDCHSGFIEEIVINHPHHVARTPHADSPRVGNDILTAPSTTTLHRNRLNAGDSSPSNPVIVLRGGSASASPSSTAAGREFELYYDDGSGSGLRPLPANMSEFLLGSGFERLIDQLSQMEIQNTGRYYNNQPQPASKAAVEAMPTVEINDSHIENELTCAVCREPFDLGIKVLNMPCNHLYHSNCILQWLQLRNSCPVCRHELPAATVEGGGGGGGGDLNSSEEVPVGLTIWRLPGGGFAVGRFSGDENSEFPVVYTEMDGGFGGGGVGFPRRVSWGNRGRERGGYFGRVLRNLFGCFGGSNCFTRRRNASSLMSLT